VPTPLKLNYDELLDGAVELMLASCRAGGNQEMCTEAARLTVRAAAILANRKDDLLPRAVVDAVDADFRDRLLARLDAAIEKDAAGLVGIDDPRDMETAVRRLLSRDAAKLT
jgi:hypothetical protein